MKQSAEILNRILVLTPSGRDASNAIQVLQQAGMLGVICQNVTELIGKYREGAGALLVAEEALTRDNAGCLVEVLSNQPQWSDVPVLVITSVDATAQGGQEILNFFAPHGNVTLVERPLRPISLVSALMAALRARRRQYELRRLMEEEEATRVRLEMAVEAGQLGHWELDLKKLTATRSLRHDQIFGYESLQPHWNFEKFIQHVVPEDRAALEARFKKSVETCGETELEFRITRPDETLAWVWIRGICIANADGKAARMLGVVADITERKKAFESLADKERRFRAVFNQQFQFMALLDPKGVVMEINDLALNATNIAKEQVVGRFFWETPFWAHLPEMRKAWPERLAHAARASGPVLSVDEYESATGEVRVADAAVTAVKGERGEVEFFIIQASDVTERTKAEKALRESSERYQMLLNSIDEGFCVIDVIFDRNNKAVDYRFLETNPAFEKQSGIHNGLGKRMREIAPNLEEHWFETYGKVALTGEAIRFQNRAEALNNRWFDLYAFRVGGPESRSVAVLFTDVTQRKRAEQQLRHQLELIQTITDNVASGLIFVDENNVPTYMNPAAERITGFSLDQIKDARLHDTLHHHHPDGSPFPIEQCPIHGASRREQARSFEDVFVRADGTFYPVTCTVAPLKGIDGPSGALMEFRDVSEQRRSERALRESEERFRALADNIPQLAWMTEADGSIAWYNRRWFEYTGTTLEEMQSEGWKRVHHPEHQDRVVRGWEECLRLGKPWEDTFPLRGKDGDYRWFLSRAFPIRNGEGRITRWFGTNTDITELRETQRALREAQKDLQKHASNLEQTVAERTARLQETISELEAFSYSVSHDLRAPLRAMQGYSHFLLEDYSDNIDATGRDYISRIVKAAERLDRLVSDILTYSRISRGKIQNSAIDVEKLIEEVIQGYPALQPDKADVLIRSPLLHVIGHEGSLTQCISNLLGNAVKFVSEGKKPRVQIWTEPKGALVRIFFKDNGVGISSEHQQRIFQMFEKAPHAKTYEGTGIGLAIVRKAVERMGGEVGVQSEPGMGSTFWIDLPSAS